jgi:EAL domain-containing protein (putative c-di-GMP-specific phosphodiesterase class I)
MQGYYFAKPLNLNSLLDKLKHQNIVKKDILVS